MTNWKRLFLPSGVKLLIRIKTTGWLMAKLICLLLLWQSLPAPAQEASAADSLDSQVKRPRTAMLMDKSLEVGQKFEQFFNGHNPKTATWLGFIPGLGQIYNKKYWKIPIVYAGFAVTGYFALTNRNEYRKFADAYVCKLAEDPGNPETECDNPLAKKYPAESLKEFRDYYRRNMELSFVIMGAWYILQILDATVDAHLYDWEVSDDLTLQLRPLINIYGLSTQQESVPEYGRKSINGLSISLRF